MKFRYLVKHNNITASEVKAYSVQNGIPMQQAKEILANRTEPMLQYKRFFRWVDVPTVYKELE